jgi:ABC-type antimicrobial peptide transport system permease subunit
VGDTDTALWGIGMKTDPQSGGELLYAAESGQETALRLVGRLPMRLSVFQGAILISETDFTRLFPSEGGYRAFLLDAPPDQAQDLAHRLNREQERLGMDAVTTLERLEAFYAVETAYLALFLVLGGLGLALGAGGAAIVVLRNLFERRAETALLHALGYERNLLWQLLFVDNGLLTGIGSLLGAGAATAAILPLVIVSRTVVAPSALILILIFVLAIQTLLVTAAVASALPRNPAATLRNE